MEVDGLDGPGGGGLPAAHDHVNNTTAGLHGLEDSPLLRVRYVHVVDLDQLVIHPGNQKDCP